MTVRKPTVPRESIPQAPLSASEPRPVTLTPSGHRPLWLIAQQAIHDPAADWRDDGPLHNAAHYLVALRDLHDITDRYDGTPIPDASTAAFVVHYFLSQAHAWHSDIATAVKAELHAILQTARARG